MRRALMVAVVLSLGFLTPTAIFPQQEEFPCCYPVSNEQGAEKECRWVPEWQCRQLRGQVVDDCSQCQTR
jgi:hypothetical protein